MKISKENQKIDKIFFEWLMRSQCIVLRYNKSTDGFISGDIDLLIDETPQNIINSIASALPQRYAIKPFCKLGTFGAIIYHEDFPSILRIDFHQDILWRNLIVFERNELGGYKFINSDGVVQIVPEINFFYKFLFFFLNKDIVRATSCAQKLTQLHSVSRQFPFIIEAYNFASMVAHSKFALSSIINLYLIFVNFYQFFYCINPYCKNLVSFWRFWISRSQNSICVNSDYIADTRTRLLVEQFYLRGIPINWSSAPKKFHLNIMHRREKDNKNYVKNIMPDEFADSILRELL